ncbi:unnamed protein product [Trifolium pratense]|uniref:Uncharacterized protein n=1 Tax=Trifolium pratense TaxID=57577 RepID=A0ACB0K440_TRIPR|nr:unnamed protein product [Trifolium pratense]
MTNEINLEMVKWFLDDSTIYVSRQGCSRIRFDVEVKNCIINMVLLAKRSFFDRRIVGFPGGECGEKVMQRMSMVLSSFGWRKAMSIVCPHIILRKLNLATTRKEQTIIMSP